MVLLSKSVQNIWILDFTHHLYIHMQGDIFSDVYGQTILPNLLSLQKYFLNNKRRAHAIMQPIILTHANVNPHKNNIISTWYLTIP